MKAQGLIGILLILLAGCSRYEGYLQGYVEADYTNLSSSVGGKLQKLYVTRGQTVTAGQRLAQLESEPELSELKKAEASFAGQQAKLKDYLAGQRLTVLAGIIAQRDQAQAQLDLSKSNFSRTAQLYQRGVVSRSNYDDALAQVKENQQRVTQYDQNLREAQQGERVYRIQEQSNDVKNAEAALAEAKWRYNQKIIFAPENGFIFDTFYTDGEEITANQPVVSFLSPRNIYLVFFIPEPLRAKLALHDNVEFGCDNCSTHHTAKVYYISPQAEYTPPVIFSRESRTKLVYRVEAQIPVSETSKVTPGQPVDVYLLKRVPRSRYFWWLPWRRS